MVIVSFFILKITALHLNFEYADKGYAAEFKKIWKIEEVQ